MSDLISRETLRKTIVDAECCCCVDDSDCEICSLTPILKCIDKAPAIEAKPVVRGDLISREALIKNLEYQLADDVDFCGLDNEFIRIGIINSVKKAPTIDAKPVRGEWIYEEDEYSEYVICSKCGIEIARIDEDDDFEQTVSELNFCYNCGANMRKENG